MGIDIIFIYYFIKNNINKNWWFLIDIAVSEMNDGGSLDRKWDPKTRIMAGVTQFVQVLPWWEHAVCKWGHRGPSSQEAFTDGLIIAFKYFILCYWLKLSFLVLPQYPEQSRDLQKGNCSHCRKCGFSFNSFIHPLIIKKLLDARPCTSVEVQLQWKHGPYLMSCCCQLTIFLPAIVSLARPPRLWKPVQLASLLRDLLHVEQ